MGIALVHGVSPTEVQCSVWKVVDAVHNALCFNIKFPECCDKQREIARKFQATSSADFDHCFGAIKGLLTWTPKPNANDFSVLAVGVKKFFCGRKNKFGLNMKGVCDVKGRYLDISIGHPGSASDYLAFVTSKLHSNLENLVF